MAERFPKNPCCIDMKPNGREIKSSNFVVRGPLDGFVFNLKMANISNISILPKNGFQYHVFYGM